MIITHPDEVLALVGETVVSTPLTIDEDTRLAFASATWVDKVSAEYTTRSAEPHYISGFHLLSIMDGALGEVFRFDAELVSSVFYGVDRVRFVATANVGEVFVLSTKIVSAISRGMGRLVMYESSLVGHNDPHRLVYVACWSVLHRPIERVVEGGG